MANNASKKVLNLTLRRQDQILTFWTSYEGIRWRFTSTFGFGAVASLFISQNQKDPEVVIVALIALFGLSICSIFCQIRIYGVLRSLWKKMITLQIIEIRELKNLGELSGFSSEQEQAFYFPQPLSSQIRLLSNTGLSCSAFALLASLAVYSATRLTQIDILWSACIAVLFFLIMLAAITWMLVNTNKFHPEAKTRHVQI